MGIYSAKLREGAIDSVQTPDEVGVDLTQVEKDIMGDDGIEAHADEVEAAQAGMLGDPVDEMYFIMYESEYNYNQLMKAIGVAELNEASYGREVIYEANIISTFIDKAVELFKSMFESLTKAVKEVLAKMDFQARADKAFVTNNKDRIIQGSSKDWEVKNVYADLLNKELKLPDFRNDDVSKITDYNKALDDLNNGREDALNTYKQKISDGEYKKAAIKSVCGKEYDDISKMSEAVKNDLFGTKKSIKNGDVSVKTVIDILSADRETRGIRNTYNEIKASYNKTINELNKLKQKTKDPKGAGSAVMSICNDTVRVAKFQKNALNTMFGTYMKAARSRRNLARHLARICFEKGKAKIEAQQNSASLFGNVKLI